jgi:hypothetical protein
VTYNVTFHLANEDITLDYPVCPEYISVDSPACAERFMGSTLQDLVCEFKREVGQKATENTIIMFRNRPPATFEEELVSKTGKVLFIPSTASPLPKQDPYPEGRIITESIEEQFEDPNFFVEGSHFERILKEKVARGHIIERSGALSCTISTSWGISTCPTPWASHLTCP